MLDLFLGMRARDDRQTRVDQPRLLDDLPAFEAVGDCDQQGPRGPVVGGGGQFRIGGIAADRLDILLVQRFDDVLVVLEYQQRDPRPAQSLLPAEAGR